MTNTPTPMRDQRLRRGMTQEDVAEQCREAGVKVGASQISRIERGLNTPYPRLRATLARVLELDIEQFKAKAS